MAALTATLVRCVDIGAGHQKMKIFTVTPQADGDTVDLSSYFDTIDDVTARISGGADANLSFCIPTVSTTTVTLAEKEQDFTAATDWTSGEITLRVYGSDSNV